MVEWGVVCLLAAYCGSKSVNAGYGQPLACAAVLQPVPISCHFRGSKAPLSSIVSGAISSELPLPFEFLTHVRVLNHVFVMNVAMFVCLLVVYTTTKWIQPILFYIG